MVSTKTQLHYFNGIGIGQQIRYTLVAGGVEFEDVLASGYPAPQEEKDKWIAIGGNSTTNVPMLTIGDKAYTQSSAVLRVAARLGGLMPKDDENVYAVDNLLAHAVDFRTAGFRATPFYGGNDAKI